MTHTTDTTEPTERDAERERARRAERARRVSLNRLADAIHGEPARSWDGLHRPSVRVLALTVDAIAAHRGGGTVAAVLGVPRSTAIAAALATDGYRAVGDALAAAAAMLAAEQAHTARRA